MSAHDRTADAPSPQLVFETLFAFQRTAALKAAIDLDVFRVIGEGPADAAAIATRCGASERGIRILCDYLTTLTLLQKRGTLYMHTPTSAVFLDPQSPASIATTSRFLATKEMIELHSHLTEIVRTGRTVLPGDGFVEPDNPAWVEFAHSMAPMMAPLAGPLGAVVLRERSGPIRVLDIAAGHGLFGIEVAKQNPHAHIVALDWKSVLEVAKANARKAGVSDRYETLPGSAFDADFGGPFDVALLTNFLHHFDVPTCVALLRKVASALRPGGMSATLEFVPNDDRVSPAMPAQFSLTMLATTRAGDAYTYPELDRMHCEAGFARTERWPHQLGPHTVVVGHMPA